ncbi:site-specific integrase [Limibacter armeniacum]|uniref:tyrosine-type recombinase/integrase n=1 Tax=Limibacter armeniacum TaxID=466084 RepID=UPI002FE5093B
MLTVQNNQQLSTGSTRIKASRLLEEYKKFLSTGNGRYENYLRVAHMFLRHCHENKQGVDEVSFNIYASAQQLKKSMKSILRKFILYCENMGYREFIYDLEKGPASETPLILKFTSSIAHIPTRRNYTYALNNYARWCSDTGKPFLAPESIIQYTESIDGVFTKNRYISIFKSLAKWILERRDSLQASFQYKFSDGDIHMLRDITMLKSFREDANQYYKDAFTDEERDFFLDCCPDSETKLLFSLMAYEALRISEACGMLVSDVNHLRRVIYVKGKGTHNKQAVNFSETSAAYFKEYISEVPLSGPELFPTTGKSKAFKIFKQVLAETGIHKDKRVSPHSLRHTALQLLINKGYPLEYVQRHARHRRIESTMVYISKAVEENYLKGDPRVKPEDTKTSGD